MEASKMSQVSGVIRKMSSSKFLKENKISVDDSVPEKWKKSEAYDVNKQEGIAPIFKEFSRNNKEKDAMHSKACMKTIENKADKENCGSEDYMRKSVNRKDQDTFYSPKKLTGEIERYIGAILLSSENIQKPELKKTVEYEKEENFISTLSNAKKENIENCPSVVSKKKLSVERSPKCSPNIRENYFAKEKDISNNLADKITLSDKKENKMGWEDTSKETTDEELMIKRINNLNTIKDDTESLIVKTSSYMPKNIEDGKSISSEDESDLEDILKEKQDGVGIKQNVTMMSTAAEERDVEIMSKEIVSQESVEKDKKEHFINATKNTSLPIEENEEDPIFKDARSNGFEPDSDVPQVMVGNANESDLSTSSEYECIEVLYFPVSPNFQENSSFGSEKRKSKLDEIIEAERDIIYKSSLIDNYSEELGVISIQSESANDPPVVLENENEFDLSSSYECIECLESLVSETSTFSSSQERNANEDLDFTPPVSENEHNLAMLATPSICADGNKMFKDLSSYENYYTNSMIASRPMELVYKNNQLSSNTSNESSPECNGHIGISNDYICLECRNNEDKLKLISSIQDKSKEEYAENPYLPNADNKANSIEDTNSDEKGNVELTPKNFVEEKCETKREKKEPSSSEKKEPYSSNAKNKNLKPGFKFSKTYSLSSHVVNEEAFEIPSDALAEKIAKEAEFYFSDFNIMKNNFILKHIRRNKEGYLSVKLVSSFRKIKSLTRDWRVVAYSLEGSKLLQLNSQKNKVRRIEAIPRVQDTSYGKTVVVFNLLFKSPTSNDIKKLFSKYGAIVTAQVLTTRSPSFNTYHKRCLDFNRELFSSKFGVVEFDKYADAEAAIKGEGSHLSKENKMKVVPLLPPKNRSEAKSYKSVSATSFASLRRNQEICNRAKSDVSISRQVGKVRPPNADIYYKGSFGQRYEWKPQTQIDIRGSLANNRNYDKVYDGERNHHLRRQQGFSHSVKDMPYHQQYRVPGRYYAFPRYQE